MFCKAKVIKDGVEPVIVFLHGFLGTGSDWERVSSYLPSCKCVAVDLPGHGDSPFKEKFDFEPPAEKFHLVGYSMGGRLAMGWAKRHPERIDHLVIASAHRGLRSEEEKKKREEWDAGWAKLLREGPMDEFLKKWYAQPLFAKYKPNFSKRGKQNVEDLAKCLIHFSLAKQEFMDVKATFIVGEFDAKYRALHPDAIVVKGATHAVHLEKPKEFADILTGELKL